jgi:hypothetical protein
MAPESIPEFSVALLFIPSRQTMARYTCLFIVSAPVETLRASVMDLLKSSDFDIIYQTEDYIMGREIPGKVAFYQLVVAEVLIDRTTAKDQEVRMSFVLKNEELPLQLDNHCRQVFSRLSSAISDHEQWKLIETVAG